MALPVLLAADSFVSVRPGLIFWTLVTFLIAAVALRRIAWRPILALVDQREKGIANAIDSAKRERAEADKLLAEQKSAVVEARREAAEMLRRNHEDVEKLRADLVARARAEAEAMKADATRAIQDERAKAVAEVKSVAVDLAIQIADKLLRERLDPGKQRALVAEYLDEVGTPVKPPDPPRPA